MTFENDPNRPDTDTLPQQPARKAARRADVSMTILPLVFGALAIFLAGYMFFGDRFITHQIAHRASSSLDQRQTSIADSLRPRSKGRGLLLFCGLQNENGPAPCAEESHPVTLTIGSAFNGDDDARGRDVRHHRSTD